MNNKQRWAEEKICTSKSLVELEDEFNRGCDNFLEKGVCNCRCDMCHLQRAYNMTLRWLKTQKPQIVNVVINGDVTIKF